jgi:hypothetical protein
MTSFSRFLSLRSTTTISPGKSSLPLVVTSVVGSSYSAKYMEQDSENRTESTAGHEPGVTNKTP